MAINSVVNLVCILQCTNEKHQSACRPVAMHPMCKKMWVINKEKHLEFFDVTKKVFYSSLRNNLTNLGFCAKVSVPV